MKKTMHKKRSNGLTANNDRLRNFLERHTLTILLLSFAMFIFSTGTAVYYQSSRNIQPNAQKDTLGSPTSQLSNVDSKSEAASKPPSVKPNQGNNSNSIAAKQNTQISKPYSYTYAAPVCTKTVIAYTTSYRLATYMSAGQLRVYGGSDGYKETCAPDSTGYTPYKVPLNPVNRIINVGDGGGSESVTANPRSVPYDEVYGRAIPACDELLQLTNNDPVAKQWCIDNVVAGILHYYGY